ncbi:MAG: hypothetical protein ACRCYS_14970 [Beijerinckiaceae bacterium]
MQHTQVFSSYGSDMNYEEDVEMKGFGLASIKTEGGAVAYTGQMQGYTKRYTHLVYGLGYIVTREELEDNLYMKVSKSRSGALARSMRVTKETVMANIINRAFNTAYLGGDGKPMIALDHPSDVGPQSNRLTVDADLSEASLEDATIQLRNATDSTGLRINLMPRKLIIPVNEMYNASRILKSTGQNDTSNNAINALKERGVFPDGVMDWAYLTDPDAWFIKTDSPDGLKLFNRRELEFTKDSEFDTENAKAKATMRFSGGWSDWRGIFGTPGA